MKTKSLVFALLTAALILSISGCGDKKSLPGVTGSADMLVAAVTIVPEKTFVEAVCGNLVEVVTMVPPGNSPENYEPTPPQMEKFHDAAVYFTIGVPTEEANILPAVKNVIVVPLHEAAARVYAEREFDGGGRDPHVWLSPKRVKVMIDAIASTMCDIDPSNELIYRENAADYIRRLDTLDEHIRSSLEGVGNRKMIVFHPAFGYFADDYGIEMFSLEEEGKEATARRLQEMTDFALAENIKVIFYQAETPSGQAEAFAEGIGGKAMELSPLAEDYINNLESMAALLAEVLQ